MTPRAFVLLSWWLALAITAGAGPAWAQQQDKGKRGDGAAERGIALYEQRDFAAAAAALDTALAAGVSAYDVELIYTVLGNALNELGRFDDAIAAHRKALEINPRFHEAWVNLGIVYRLLGEYDHAEQSYLKALELAPDYAELHASLGALYIFRDEAPRAVESLERAIRLDRTLAVAHANLAIAYAMIGKFDAAESKLRQAIVLGYRNGAVVRERIDALRAAKREP
ncbi:MAG: tetratricopeptide repeat protein [Gemmatimonadales bacterium]